MAKLQRWVDESGKVADPNIRDMVDQIDDHNKTPYQDSLRMPGPVREMLARTDRAIAEIRPPQTQPGYETPNPPKSPGQQIEDDIAELVRDGSAGCLDPVITGLFTHLPTRGTVWPLERRKHWLALMEMTFKLIYLEAPCADIRAEMGSDAGNSIGVSGSTD